MTDIPRTSLQGALEELFGQEEANRIVGDIVSYTENEWVSCTNCKHRVEVPKPDPLKRIKALQIAVEMVYGKLPEKKTVDVNVLVAANLAELESLPLHELAKQAGIVDAEWEELGPPELPPAA